MIRAECHSDDFRAAARFDATPFFENASDDEILALAECGWGGDYAADAVARDVESRPGYGPVEDALDLARSTPGTGFECHVHEPDALRWLRDNKPELHARVCAAQELDPATPFGDERAPRWDADPSWGGPYAVPAAPVPGAP